MEGRKGLALASLLSVHEVARTYVAGSNNTTQPEAIRSDQFENPTEVLITPRKSASSSRTLEQSGLGWVIIVRVEHHWPIWS